MIIKDIMITRNISVDIQDNIEDTLSFMVRNGNGVVVVLSNGIISGIITERDIISLASNIQYLNFKSSIKNSFTFGSVIKINCNRSVEYGLNLLLDNNIRRLVVVDNDNCLVGIVTQNILIKNLDDYAFKSSIPISDFINTHSKLITLDKDSSIFEAIKIMNRDSIGSVIVRDNNGYNIGIVSEKDILFNMYYKNNTDKPISTIMSSPIICVKDDEKTDNVIEMMRVKNIRRVLIVESQSNKPLMLVTTRDFANNIQTKYTHLLEKKLKHIKSTLNYIGESVLEVRKDGNEYIVEWANQMAIKNFGEVIESDISVLMDFNIMNGIFENLAKDGQFKKTKMKQKGKYYEVIGSYYLINNKEVFLMIFKDVSKFESAIRSERSINALLKDKVDIEVKRNQKQQMMIMQQSRLAQMGEMISMIAHQWRQPLNALSINIENLEDDYDEGLINKDFIKYFIKEQNETVKFMSKTIDNFRTFFEPDREMERLPLTMPINKVLQMIETPMGYKGIKIIKNYLVDDKLDMYVNEIMQVILNILKNSEDNFMDLNIRCPIIKIETKKYKDWFIIEISDNGGGVDNKIINNIFDPYFSTKKKKSGTGLGLYMSKIMIEEHSGGLLSVTNNDDGAVFRISLQSKKDI